MAVEEHGGRRREEQLQDRDGGGHLVRNGGVPPFPLLSAVPGYPDGGEDAPDVGAERDGPPSRQRPREPRAGDDDAERAVDGLGKGARAVVVRRVDGYLPV